MTNTTSAEIVPYKKPLSCDETANNNASDIVALEEQQQQAPNLFAAPTYRRHQQPHRFFVVCVFSVLAGMGLAIFALLAGGKVGYALPMNIMVMIVYGAIDISVNVNAPQEADPEASVLSSHFWLRGVCWLAIGILQGIFSTLHFVSLDVNKAGAVWQPVPVLYELAFLIICRIGLPMALTQAHRDRQRSTLKWYIMVNCAFGLATLGYLTPYPLVSTLGSVATFLIATVGFWLVVAKFDKDAKQRRTPQNGCNLAVGFAFAGVFSYFNLYATSLTFLGPFAASGMLMVYQKTCLKCCIPTFKRLCGEDGKKLWTYVVPAVLLALELGPCLLLLGSNMATRELLLMQEINSVASNTGKYAELHVAVRAMLHRLVDGETRKLSEERRVTIAPCDNIGEIASPVVILIAIGLESLFDALPIERAPYFAKSGIFGGWRNQRFRGEAPIMLTIVLFVRIVFCWVEMKVRACQHRNDATNRSATDVECRAPRSDDEVGEER